MLLFGGGRREGARSVPIAVVSTVVFFAVVIVAVVSSPGWPEVRQQFFNWSIAKSEFPSIAGKFAVNIVLFCVGEVIILALSLFLAVLRSLTGSVFFPLRLLAILYVDLVRAVPTILIVYMLGFGVPALALQGLPTSSLFWAMVGLVVSYSAYVSEVYRAGMESVHLSQVAAARSLGLSRWQSLRFVVIPQAVRRVIPPLLNDFISLQKDTALVAFVAVQAEAFRQAQIAVAGDFNYTPYLDAAVLFIVVTIPLTRLADWLLARERSRRQAGVG